MNLRRSFFVVTAASLLLGFTAPRAIAQQTSVSSIVFADGEASDGGSSDSEEGVQSSTAGARTFNAGTGFASASVSHDPLAGVELREGLPQFHVDASASDTGLGADDTAMATFTDASFDFLADPIFDADNDIITLKFDVNGSLSGSSGADFFVSWGSHAGDITLHNGGDIITLDETTAGLTLTDITSNNGTPIHVFSGALEISLSAFANAGGPESGISATTSEADFKDTVQLAEIDVTDANGNPVPGTFFDTNSDGSAGPISFAANTNLIVPEPGTAAMLATALLVLALGGWRRARWG